MKPIILNATTKSIEALLAGAVTATQPDFTSHYADANGSTFVEGEQDGTLNSTTPVTIISAPGSGVRRLVSDISIYNADSSPVTLTVRYNNNGTYRIIYKGTIPVGGHWILSEGTGFYTPPATTALNDVQMGDGSGNWIKQTLAQLITALRTTLDTVYMAIVSPGTSGNVLTSNGFAWTSAAPAAGGELKNYLINGGFNFAQRQTPGTLTTITDNKYSADRWRVTRENTDVQYARVDATGEAGLTSKWYGQYKKITTTGKFHICQIVEGVNSVPLRSKTIIFQCQMKASAAKTIRMAVLELQNAGTMDTIPATLVTAFGANGTDPTLGTNVAIITGAQSKSVTTSWQTFSVSVTVPSNSKNIICALWTDSQFAANDILNIAEAGLYVSASAQAWIPVPIQADFAMCQRYFEKTWDTDTVPGTAAALSEFDNRFPATPAAGFALVNWRYKNEKFKAPTVHSYDAPGTIDKCSYITSLGGAQSDGQVVTVDHIGVSASRIYTDSTTAKCGLILNATAEAEL